MEKGEEAGKGKSKKRAEEEGENGRRKTSSDGGGRGRQNEKVFGSREDKLSRDGGSRESLWYLSPSLNKRQESLTVGGRVCALAVILTTIKGQC